MLISLPAVAYEYSTQPPPQPTSHRHRFKFTQQTMILKMSPLPPRHPPPIKNVHTGKLDHHHVAPHCLFADGGKEQIRDVTSTINIYSRTVAQKQLVTHCSFISTEKFSHTQVNYLSAPAISQFYGWRWGTY